MAKPGAVDRPKAIPLFRGESEIFTELRCYADDPDALVASAREHLAEARRVPARRTD